MWAPRTSPAMSTTSRCSGISRSIAERLAQPLQALVRHGHDRDVRLDGREGILGRLRAAAGERVEERRLAGVRQPDDPDLHRQPRQHAAERGPDDRAGDHVGRIVDAEVRAAERHQRRRRRTAPAAAAARAQPISVAPANDVAACADGNDSEVGTAPAGSMPSSRGRSRRTASFTQKFRPSVSGTPSAAHSQRARRGRSASAPAERAGDPHAAGLARPTRSAAIARSRQRRRRRVRAARAGAGPPLARGGSSVRLRDRRPSPAARRTPAGCRARRTKRQPGAAAPVRAACPDVTMCGSTNISPTISRPPGFRTRATSLSARSWSGISPSTVISTTASKLSSSYGSACASPERGLHVRDAAPVGLPHHVVEHLLLDVEDVDLAAVAARPPSRTCSSRCPGRSRARARRRAARGSRSGARG